MQHQCRAPLSPAIGSEVQFPQHIRESLQGHTGRCENIPQSLLEEGKLFIFCVATSKEPDAYRTTASPTGQSNSTTKLGGGIARGWDGASSFISARECQAGQRGAGQPIDLEQAHQFREVSEETGLSGKMAAKLIWERVQRARLK